MNKNKIIIFGVLSFIIVAALPVINLYSETGKYEIKKAFNTDIIEKYINYSFYKIYGISLESSKVVVGQDEFLFLGNHYNNVLHRSQGLFDYQDEELGSWLDKLKTVQNWYESRGIQFVIVIAPNKHSVYNEKMAEWSQKQPDKKTITDDIITLSQKYDVNMLDLREPLIKNKDNYEDLLYLKTDTHWNELGASIAYEETINYLNNKYKMNYQTPEYSYIHVGDKGKGLANFLKITSILPSEHEESIWFDFKIKYNVCWGYINKSSHELMPCKRTENPRYSINEHPQYIINSSSLNKVNALVLADSFSTHNSQLYNATFSNLWKFHYGSINGTKLADFVTQHAPDIVIYQLVERGLVNKGIAIQLP
jgi:alginate O-acetyltransferase complex protein AlgJ